MNNKEFVEKHAAHIRAGAQCPGRNGRAQSGAHIYCEGDHLESYGSHYPLMYRITSKSGAPLLVVNARGYSNSTAKHINYAHMAAYRGGEFVTVYASSVIPNASSVIEHLKEHIDLLERNIAQIKRRNTKRESSLRADIARAQADINKITN